jgi:Uma2 family endonuclease
MVETARRTWTYEDLLAEGLDPKLYEIHDGELVEDKPLSLEGSRNYMRLGHLLFEYAEGHRLGTILIGGRFLLRKEPRRERRPDLAFLPLERYRATAHDPMYPGAPDLAVEVLSPSDSTSEASAKAREYLDAGSRAVWIVDPELKTVTVLRPGRPPRPFGVGDTITGEDILPGFELSVAELFAPI